MDRPTVCPKCGHQDLLRPRGSAEQTAFAEGQRLRIVQLMEEVRLYRWMRRNLLIVDLKGKEPAPEDYDRFDAAVAKEIKP